MSLPVGTLVMLVRSRRHPEMNGTVTTIVGSLEWRKCWDGEQAELVLCYLIDLGPPFNRFGAEPHQVIPITPPPGSVDIDEREPRMDGVAA